MTSVSLTLAIPRSPILCSEGSKRLLLFSRPLGPRYRNGDEGAVRLERLLTIAFA
jgi:hypothetical protein